MLHKQKFVQAGKLLICGVLLASLSGCYLSLGGGGKKKNNDDGKSVVVVSGASPAPAPIIVNSSAPQTEQPLKPTNQ
ncbi:hypothetical protein [Wielerella bovis]|uniref:hypothetical protein n=1 Tax=Wielerella bovis TaxID=2917790 RepID=UPI0020187538|nr:hypothetical protein [Wielerella bovis]ULJ59788.1 hypothetical protein MIS44_08900 [Wielerella bovis]